MLPAEVPMWTCFYLRRSGLCRVGSDAASRKAIEEVTPPVYELRRRTPEREEGGGAGCHDRYRPMPPHALALPVSQSALHGSKSAPREPWRRVIRATRRLELPGVPREDAGWMPRRHAARAPREERTSG